MKTSIRRLDSLTHNDTAATKLINDNFEALQQGIEDSLSRTGKTPNFMDAPLDMNMNRIINIADPVDDYDLANKHYVDEAIDAEETRAKAAEKAINDTLATYGNIVTHNADEFATAEQGAKADTALQPGDLPTVGNGTISLVQGGVLKGTFTVNQDSNEIINLDAGGSGGDTSVIEVYPVSVSIAEGSTTTSADVTSYVDLSKNYLPIAIFHEVATANVLKYCSYTHSSSAASVNFFSNGYIVGDTGVAVYLIPVESSLTTVRGLTNGIGEVTTALSGKQDTISDLSTIRSGAEQGATAVQPAALEEYQTVDNLVTSVSSASTDSQYPSAKLFYDTCGDIETLINAL